MSRKIGYILGLGVPLLALLTCTGLIVPIVELPLVITFGIFTYPARVLPQVRIGLPTLALFAVCLIIVFALTHTFLRWLFSAMQAETSPTTPLSRPAQSITPDWPIRGTAGLLASIFLLFAIGMSATGVAHQTAWLLVSDPPMYRLRLGMADKIRCAANMRQLYQALTLYAQSHNNRLPDTLAELVLTADIDGQLFVCPGSASLPAASDNPAELRNLVDQPNGEHLSYIYYGRGLSFPLPDQTPLLAESLNNHDERGINLLTADGQVDYLTPAQVVTLLGRTPPMTSPSTQPR